MTMKTRAAAAALAAAFVAWMAGPAQAQEDTTPPVLVSMTLSPTTIDTSASEASVTVTAVITDDLSGLDDFESGLMADGGLNYYGWFTLVEGDTYTATLTWPQYSSTEVFRDWLVLLVDNVGNEACGLTTAICWTRASILLLE